jgi:ferrous iron transport protein A
MTLREAKEGIQYRIREIVTDDRELDTFLFSLGCYKGEPITVISHLKNNCIVSIKDGRYSIDKDLAESILI